MRDAERIDLSRIVEIYNAAVPTRFATADTDKVSVEEKREWFEKHVPGKRPLLVHEEGGQIIGWLSFESFYGRPAYDYTAEISIYIDPAHCSNGVGTRLMQEAIELTPKLGLKTVVGYIFSHNELSIGLFKKFGFEEWGRLPYIAEMDGEEYSLSILGRRIVP
ncbi:GNAT family N-acetyltransferase [Maridesulfovibrio zosterae]|uniref:GNAT family N-acetyltransferase n=1 Tax=Maridesulfovibrio zosterae TaxID=82171 RepID=UPI00040C534F|nr:GNAT family N-acetyltransferase [Maridesulfovibrio zosterae]